MLKCSSYMAKVIPMWRECEQSDVLHVNYVIIYLLIGKPIWINETKFAFMLISVTVSSANNNEIYNNYFDDDNEAFILNISKTKSLNEQKCWKHHIVLATQYTKVVRDCCINYTSNRSNKKLSKFISWLFGISTCPNT